MKHKILKPVKDNEWIQPRMKKYLMGCCDCGLGHWMDFRVVYNPKKNIYQVQLKASRAEGYTKRLRSKIKD